MQLSEGEKEEDIDDDANDTRNDPMVVDSSHSDDADSFEIEAAFRKAGVYAKKKATQRKYYNLSIRQLRR